MHTSQIRRLPDEETAPKLPTHRGDRTEADCFKSLRKWGQRLMADDALPLAAACGAFARCSKYRMTVLVMLTVLS